jgi:hypothetical protein
VSRVGSPRQQACALSGRGGGVPQAPAQVPASLTYQCWSRAVSAISRSADTCSEVAQQSYAARAANNGSSGGSQAVERDHDVLMACSLATCCGAWPHTACQVLGTRTSDAHQIIKAMSSCAVANAPGKAPAFETGSSGNCKCQV